MGARRRLPLSEASVRVDTALREGAGGWGWPNAGDSASCPYSFDNCVGRGWGRPPANKADADEARRLTSRVHLVALLSAACALLLSNAAYQLNTPLHCRFARRQAGVAKKFSMRHACRDRMRQHDALQSAPNPRPCKENERPADGHFPSGGDRNREHASAFRRKTANMLPRRRREPERTGLVANSARGYACAP